MYSNKAFLRCSFYTDMNETSFLSTKPNLVVAGNIYQLESFGEMRTGLNVAYHPLFLSGKWWNCFLWLRSLLGLLGNRLAVTNLFFWQCSKTQHLNKSRTSWDPCSYFIRLFSFLLPCFNPLYQYLQQLHHGWVEVLYFYLSELSVIFHFPYLGSLIGCKHHLYLHCSYHATDTKRRLKYCYQLNCLLQRNDAHPKCWYLGWMNLLGTGSIERSRKWVDKCDAWCWKV